jgi:MFS family permease
MNRVLKVLMLCDLFVESGLGLIGPIFAIFIDKDVSEGNVFSAGLACFIYLMSRSIGQLALAKQVDKWNMGKTLRFLILGNLILSLVPLIYIGWKTILGVYIAEFVCGLGSAFDHPCWLKLWSVYLDRDHESYEWSLYSVAINIGSAVAALVGGVIASYVGFDAAFILVTFLCLCGTSTLYAIRKTIVLDSINKISYNRSK